MTKTIRSLLLLAVVAILTIAASAQDPRPVNDTQRPPVDQVVPQDRAAMLKMLDLTPFQLRQVRMVNQERKPLMDAAQAKLHFANKALDDAIYADNVSDVDVQARIKDVHAAQAEVIRIRSMNELAIRRILNPEQLVRFRVMRQRFEEARQNAVKNKQSGPPMRRALRPQPGATKPLKD